MTIQAFARCAALVAAMAAPLAASADDYNKDKAADKADKTKLTDAELQVLAHFHQANLSEIALGKLAMRNSKTAAIKDYGKMLVTDHQKNDRDLKALAKKHGQMIPTETAMSDADKSDMKDEKDAMKKLEAMKGADFDREFLQMAVQDHEKELARADTAIGEVQSDDLKTMLQDMKPVLQRHADKARDLQKNNAEASIQNEPDKEMPAKP
jgi:putative membrane protein